MGERKVGGVEVCLSCECSAEAVLENGDVRELSAVPGAGLMLDGMPCSGWAPWDTAEALERLNLRVRCRVEAVETGGEKLKLRLLADVHFNAREGDKLPVGDARALAALAARGRAAIAALMPSETAAERKERLLAGGACYSLAAMYRLSHLLATGRALHDVGADAGLGSLVALATTRSEEKVVRPRSNASIRAARELINAESREQERLLGSSHRIPLFCLPASLLCTVARYLCAKDLRALRRCCKFLDYTCATVVPGLTLELYSHQKRALRWMDLQENPRAMRTRLEIPDDVRCLSQFGGCVKLQPGLCADNSKELVVELRSGEIMSLQAVPEPTKVIGGMLCDEPGLGKTVTMLALILRTAGSVPLQADPSRSPRSTISAASVSETSFVDEHWQAMDWHSKENIVVEFLSALRKTIKAVEKSMPERVLVGAQQTIFLMKRNLGEGSFSSRVNSFICLAKRMPDWFPHVECQEVENMWQPMIDCFVNNIMNVKSQIEARFRISRGIRSCASRDKVRELEDARTKNLIESGATLVVVPKTLLEHWKNQVHHHVKPSYFGVGNLSDLFFFDTNNLKSDLPSAERLARYAAVFTTMPRLTKEESTSGYKSSLRRIHWMRLIVDEGHYLGQSSKSLYGNFLIELVAVRRWVMTGTPAKETSLQEGLSSLLGLLRFLRFDPFGTKGGSLLWQCCVARPLEQRIPLGVPQVVALLSGVMMRHTKIDVAELPPVKLRSISLFMSASERNSYNAIVSYGRANIVLTEMGNDGVGFDLSLLNPSNQHRARLLMTNVRVSCSGGGHMNATIRPKDWLDTRQLLVNKHGASARQLRRANDFIVNVTRGNLVKCQRRGCGIKLSMMLMTPCVHFVCVDCFENHCVKVNQFECFTCGKSFSSGEFARLQPGFELRWVDQTQQQKISNDSWLTNGSTEISSKAHYIMEKLSNLRKNSDGSPLKCIVYSQFRTVLNALGHHLIQQFGATSVAEFWGAQRNLELRKYTHNEAQIWECGKCGKDNDPAFSRCERRFVKLKPESGRSQTLEKVVADDSLSEWFLGKEFYIGERVKGDMNRFTMHREWLKVVEVTRCSGKAKHANWTRNVDVDCFILLLSRDGSTGLDLSMTSHIFLVDRIWDAAHEDQVISRAWRLGAKSSEIVVEQLYINGTVEELMYDYRPAAESKSVDLSKLHFLLSNMKLIVDESIISDTEEVPDDDDDDEQQAEKKRRSRNDVPESDSTETKKRRRVQFAPAV